MYKQNNILKICKLHPIYIFIRYYWVDRVGPIMNTNNLNNNYKKTNRNYNHI